MKDKNMKIKVLQDILKTVLPMLQKVIPSKPQLQILSSILIIAEKDSVEFLATDLYMGVRASIKADVIEEGRIVVQGEVFRELISSFSSGEMSLYVKEGVLFIESDKSKTSLQLQSSDDYPEFPEVEGLEFDIEVENLKKLEKYVVFATSSDQNRPVLTTVLFTFSKEGLELVATDGYRLSTLLLKQIKSQKDYKIMIPAKALREVLRIAIQQQAKHVSFTVSEELKQVLFKIDGVGVYIRLIEGEYPPYEKIIPPGFKYEFEIDGEELLSQVKRAQIFAKNSSNIVRLGFEKELMFVKANSPSIGEFYGELSVKGISQKEDDDLKIDEIAFNSLYLIDFLTTVKPERLWFGMNESLKPAMFKEQEVEDFRYIIMPFRVNN